MVKYDQSKKHKYNTNAVLVVDRKTILGNLRRLPNRKVETMNQEAFPESRNLTKKFLY
jgi:hypothetical protein